MKILHLSDLHYKKNNNYEKIKNALLQDFDKLNLDKEISIVAVTGDLFDRGDTSIDRVKDLKDFLDEIKERLPKAKFIFCPGNHDINLKKIKPSVSKALSFMKRESDYSDVIFDDDYSIHFSDYIDISRHINENHYSKNNFVHIEKIEISGKIVGVVSFNSSWLTSGGGVGDYGNLAITKEQIDYGVSQVSGCDIKISLVHHTFEWLNEKDKRYFEVLMLRDFDILLNGHNHNNITYNYNTNFGTLFLSNTASLSIDKNNYSSYNLINIDFISNKISIEAREFFDNRNLFDVSTRFSPLGRFESEFIVAGGHDISIDFAKLIELTDRHNENLLSYNSSDVAPKSISKIFVEPPIYDKSIAEMNSYNGSIDSDNLVRFDLDKISLRQSNVVFLGKKESGRTTLLNHIAINCRTNFSRSSLLGVVIDFNSCKPRENAILEECSKFYENELRKSEVRQLLEKGLILVCIDNFDKDNSILAKEFFNFIAKYNKCRYIIGSIEEDISEIQRKFFEEKGFEVFYIHQYTKDHTLKLAENWFGQKLQDIPDKANALERLLVNLKIPRTPFITSVLLWVIENSANKSLIINYASAVELLIDGLLDKINNTASRNQVDIHDQKHFLTLFSMYLHGRGQVKVDILEFDQFAIDFFKSRLLSASPLQFTRIFFDKGILINIGGEVLFKFDCFRAYFLGQNFDIDGGFLCEALKFENVRKYSVELDFYTGTKKAKLDILKSINDVSKKVLKDVEYLNSDDLLNNLARFGDVPDADFSEVEASLSSDADLENNYEIDLHVSEDNDGLNVPQDILSKQQDLFRPFVEIISYAKVISNIVRNLELVNDPALKKESFENILKIWSLIFSESFVLADKNNDLLVGLYDEDQLEYIRSFSFALIPQSIIIMMCECLANPKMDVVYNDYIRSEAAFSEKLVSVLLTAEAGSSNWINNIDYIIDIAVDYSAKKMLGQVLFLRLISLLLTKVMTGKEQNSIKEIAANLFILTNGLTNESSHKISLLKQKFKSDIEKKMLNYSV